MSNHRAQRYLLEIVALSMIVLLFLEEMTLFSLQSKSKYRASSGHCLPQTVDTFLSSANASAITDFTALPIGTLLPNANLSTVFQHYLSTSFVLDRGLRAFPHFIPQEQLPGRQDVTLSTHAILSQASIEQVRQTATLWDGPVSCAVWLAGDPVSEMEKLHTLTQAHAADFGKTTFHVVWTTGSYEGPAVHVNHLMRVAVAAAKSQFIIVSDSPLLPSPGMHSRLVVLVSSSKWRSLLHLGSNAILIPVFQTTCSPMLGSNRATGPRSKADAADMLKPVAEQLLEALGHTRAPRPEELASHFSKWWSNKGIIPSQTGGLDSAILVSRRWGLLPDLPASTSDTQCMLRMMACWRKELNVAGYSFFMDAESYFAGSPGRQGQSARRATGSQGAQFQKNLQERYGQFEGRQAQAGTTFIPGVEWQTFEVQQCAEQRADSGLSVTCGTHEFARPTVVQGGGVMLGENLTAFTAFARARREVAREEITLVTQISYDPAKMVRLVEAARRWEGAVSVSVLLNASNGELAELVDLAADIVRYQEALAGTSFHVVYGESRLYPFNHLRNVAMNAVDSNFAFLVDVDLVPSPGLREGLHKWMRDTRPELEDWVQNGKGVLVIPAFEQTKEEFMQKGVHAYAEAVEQLPKSTSELAILYDEGRITMFHERFKAGHGPTDYSKWFSKPIQSYEIQYSRGYEPYVVVGVHGLQPQFNGKMMGWGKNKISWLQELHFAGYEFTVLSGGFLIHIWHPGGGDSCRQMDEKVQGFYNAKLQEMAYKYEVETKEHMLDLTRILNNENCGRKSDHKKRKRHNHYYHHHHHDDDDDHDDVDDRHRYRRQRLTNTDTGDEGLHRDRLQVDAPEGEGQPKASDAGMHGIDSHRFVFVGGPHHAGTTLMAMLIGGHGDVSGFHDTPAARFEDEGQYLQSVYPTDAKLGGMGKYAFKPNSHLTEQSAICTENSQRKLFASWAKYWDLSRPVLAEKTPSNIVMSRFIQKLFTPERTKFVFVIRHPLGATKHFWARDRGGKVQNHCGRPLIEHWLKQMVILAQDLPYLRNARVVVYEQFMNSPESYHKKLLHFLELDEARGARLFFETDGKNSRGGRKRVRGSGKRLLNFHGEKDVHITSGRATIQIAQEKGMSWKSTFEQMTRGSKACEPMMAQLEESVNRFGYSLLNPDVVTPPLPFQRWLLRGDR